MSSSDRRSGGDHAAPPVTVGSSDPGVVALVRARRLLRDGRIIEAIEVVDAAADAIRHTGEMRPAWMSLQADILAAAGRFGSAVDVASRAVAGVEKAGVRRRAAAWLSLAFAEGLAGVAGERRGDPLKEAEGLVAANQLEHTLTGRRIRRLRARILSANGDIPAAAAILDATGPADPEPTRAARREALRAADERAILLLRGSEIVAAIEAFEDCRRNWTALMRADAPQALTARHNLAITLRRSNRRNEAMQILRDVVTARSATIGANHPDTLVSQSFWLLQRAEGGDATAAGESAETLLAARRQLGDTHVFTLGIAGRHASIQDLKGDVAGALATLEEWAKRAEAALGPEHLEAGSLLHEYGRALRTSGELAKAYRVFSTLAEATLKVRGETHIETLATYNNLAVVASDLGESQVAEALYRDLLDAFAKIGDTYALAEASVQTNLAHLLLTSGRVEEGRALFERTLATRQRLLEPANRLIHLSRSNLAAALAKTGRLEEAIDMHRHALADRTHLFGPEDPQTLDSLHNLASTLDEAGRPSEAAPLFEEAVRARRNRLGARHPSTIVSQRSLGGVLRALGQREEATTIYREILAAVEDLRHEGDLPDELRRSLFAQYVPAYRALAFLAVERGEVGEAFAIAEKIKARTLIERSASRQRVQSLHLERGELSRLRDLERRIATADARIPTIPDPAGRNRATVERDALLEDWRGLTRTLRDATPAYERLNDIRLLTAEEGVRELAPDERFLTFVSEGDRIAAIWLDPNHGLGCRDLAPIPGLVETLRALRAVLASGRVDRGIIELAADETSAAVWRMADGSYRLTDPDDEPDGAIGPIDGAAEILGALSKTLIADLPASLFAPGRLIISPDSALAALPFEVLRLGGQELLERCVIAYLPSLSFGSLVARRTDGKAGKSPLIAIGAPDYEPQPALRRNAPGNEAKLFCSERFRSRRRGSFENLVGADAELSDLAALFGLVPGQTLFKGPNATGPRIKQLGYSGGLRNASALAFSAHGYLDPEDARRNAIVLGAEGDEESAFLTAAEILAFELDAELVFLSACDTGAGPFTSGEGVLGLPFAFMAAGSRSVVQTLWPIFDEASAILVGRFFRLYRDGTPVSDALALAKRALASGAEGEEYRDPVYWAAFLCYGR